MRNLTITQGKYSVSYVYNEKTQVATIEWKKGGYIISHKFDFLGIKNNSELGTFKTEEECLPKINQILDLVIKKLS